MVNTYTYTGPGERWALKDPTAVDYLNVSRVNCDHLHEALNTIMDTDAADGVVTGTVGGGGGIGTIDMSWSGGGFGAYSTSGNFALWFFLADDGKYVAKKTSATTTPVTPSSSTDYNVVVSELVELAAGPGY